MIRQEDSVANYSISKLCSSELLGLKIKSSELQGSEFYVRRIIRPSHRIKLTFETFRLESHSKCRYDYLQISFGAEEEKYCGSDVPSPIISSGNTMTITFHSDHTKVKKGFKATWEAVTETEE